MVLASVAFSIAAFSIAALLSGLYLLGKDKGKNSDKTLGSINIMVGIALFISSLLLFITTPFGTGVPAANVELGFSVLQVFFAFVWIAFGLALLYGWDVKFVGSMALLLFVYNVIAFVLLPWKWSAAFTTVGLWITEIAMFTYLLDEVGFFALSHGKLKASVQGAFLILSAIASIALALVVGGVFPL